MAEAPPRDYTVQARSTDTFGRVLVSARQQHVIADGPVTNGCPGEAIGPAELFLAGVATCGVELMQVLARDSGVSLGQVSASIEGVVDPSKRTRDDVSLFASVTLRFAMSGIDEAQAHDLVEQFKRR
jgi:uncharacterized OsmC-like protein